MSTRSLVLGLAAIVASVDRFASVDAGGTSNVTTCVSGYGFSINSLNQTPCLVDAYLQAQCTDDDSFRVDELQPGYHFAPPTTENGEANKCGCSSVVYNLLMACSGCMNRTTTTWNAWIRNCSADLTSLNWPMNLPTGTAVPHWAYVDPSTWTNGIFNSSEAALIGDSTESVASSVVQLSTTTTSSSSSSSSSSSTSAPASQSSDASPSSSSSSGSGSGSGSGNNNNGGGGGGGSSNTGAIVGGVVGGIVGLALIAGLTFFILRRNSNSNSHTNQNGNGNLNGDGAGNGHHASMYGGAAAAGGYQGQKVSPQMGQYGSHRLSGETTAYGMGSPGAQSHNGNSFHGQNQYQPTVTSGERQAEVYTGHSSGAYSPDPRMSHYGSPTSYNQNPNPHSAFPGMQGPPGSYSGVPEV